MGSGSNATVVQQGSRGSLSSFPASAGAKPGNITYRLRTNGFLDATPLANLVSFPFLKKSILSPLPHPLAKGILKGVARYVGF